MVAQGTKSQTEVFFEAEKEGWAELESRERERVSLGCKLERKLHKVHQPAERNLSQTQIQMKYELDPLVFGDIELLFVVNEGGWM